MSALLVVLRLGRPVTARLALAMLAGAGSAACAIGLTATSAWLIVKAAEQPPIVVLMVAITAVRAFGIGRGVLRYAERLAAHDAALRVLGEVRATVYTRLGRLAPAGLGELRSGDLLARLIGDVDSLADLWLRVLLPYAAVSLVGIATVLLVGVLVPASGLVLAVSLVATALGAPLAAAIAGRRGEAILAPARGAVAGSALDMLRGAPEILVAGAAPRAVADFRRIDATLAVAERRSAAGAGMGSLVAGLTAGTAVWLGLILGIEALRRGHIDGPMLALVVLVPIAVHEVTSPLVLAAARLPGIAAAAARVTDIVQRPDPVPDPEAPVGVPAGSLGIRARGLCVRYPNATTTSLGPLDLDVPAGARVVVTGPSGAGKSTLAAALVRFLDPSAGTLVLIGDRSVDVSEVAGDDVRGAVGLCQQDPHLFDATIADNLRLARPGAPEPDLRASLRAARLLPWVDSLPAGLHTAVGEHGARLSAGQRQRLALARVLLADVRVLVLDEPTEHLDEATARALVDDLEQATVGRTVVVLTHRPELFIGAGWSRGPELRVSTT